MHQAETAASGSLHRLDPDLTWRRMDTSYGVANGPTFSRDGRILYHSDSAARTVYAFDLAADGTLTGKRAFLRFPEAWGWPDGMTTDSEGCLWIAHWGGGRLSRVDPEGRLMRAIPLPAPTSRAAPSREKGSTACSSPRPPGAPSTCRRRGPCSNSMSA